jgi:F-type H+-transporting ATPase subunit a
MFRISRDISSVHPDIILTIGDWKVANTTLFSVFITIVFATICCVAYKKYRAYPGKIQAGFEIMCEAMENLMAQITGSKQSAKIIFPIIATVFVYIATANLLGMIPGLTTITFNGVALFRSPTSDFNTTFGLAFAAVIALQVVSIRDFGIFGHLNKFVKVKEVTQGFKKSIGDGFMSLVDFSIGLLDIIGEFAKVVSLSLRLFGNMYAGEVLSTLILGAFAFFLPVTWSAMSLLSGIVQSIVFGSLVTSYYMLSAKEPEPEEQSAPVRRVEPEPAK